MIISLLTIIFTVPLQFLYWMKWIVSYTAIRLNKRFRCRRFELYDVTVKNDPYKSGFVVDPDGEMEYLKELDVDLKPSSAENPRRPFKANFSTVLGEQYEMSGNVIEPIILNLGYGLKGFLEVSMVEFTVRNKKGVGIIFSGEIYDVPKPNFKPVPTLSLPQNVPLTVKFTDDISYFGEISGGKGSSLGKLTQLSKEEKTFIVPKGIIVTTSAYKEFLTPEILEAVKNLENIAYGKENGNLKEACNEVSCIVEKAQLPNQICQSIIKDLSDIFGDDVKQHKFAVRSSATGEDTAAMSAAGQMDTFLGVQGILEIFTSVKKCWASQFGYIAIEYKRRNGQVLNSPMAVVIQEMVACDVSGVLFTCDPVTNNPSVITITANYGLGESRPVTNIAPETEYEMKHELDIPLRCETEYFSVANVGEVMPGASSPLGIDNLTKYFHNFFKIHALTKGLKKSNDLLNEKYHLNGPVPFMNHMMLKVIEIIGPNGIDSQVSKGFMISMFGRVLKDPEMLSYGRERFKKGMKPPLKTKLRFYWDLFTHDFKLEKVKKKIDAYHLDFLTKKTAKETFVAIVTSCSDFDESALTHVDCLTSSSVWNMIMFSILSNAKGDDPKHIVENPYIPISIVVLYTVFVIWLGPFIMKSREPYKLKKILIFYNFFQVVANAFICIEIFIIFYKRSNSLCKVKSHPELPEILKVFFVLRKKQAQVTFLHVFHHSGICLLVFWFMIHTEEVAGSYCAFAMGLNSGIHVLMYIYYGIAALGPNMKKYLWWKKYLTALQIGQLCIIFLYMFISVLIGCEELGAFSTITFIYLVFVIILFVNFYAKYRKPRTQKTVIL
ncbi:elongation of very long chain fatty acids protein 4 [Trichonephila inaurata madagascariensis]|uniref:Elongation of very long chain fatty acids protein 4 n=1 Tax=Trichonephila inaurata madagascariensis TaxID=2747483 RepID=A0A8X7BU95_9ARAC|nr:elongation of very long chain fatty acids protein 4 [Trichonephila inaurata madagascariensis]